MTSTNDSDGLSVSSSGVRYLAFGLPLALLVAVLAYHFWIRHDSTTGDGSSAERIQPIAGVELAPPPNAATQKGKRAGLLVAHQSCRSCHSSGEGGAPKIGDRKDWAPRINQGLGVLVQSVASGKCGIPKGGSDADEMELARAVVYMIWPRMRL